MQPTAEMTRSTWWAFGRGGAPPASWRPRPPGSSWGRRPPSRVPGKLVAGIALSRGRRPGPRRHRPRRSVPRPRRGGVVFGTVGVLLPSLDPRIAWSPSASGRAGRGRLPRRARIARAFRVPDGGLLRVAWIAIATGIATSTLPTFGLGASTLAAGAALALTGAITIVASLRLRILPDEAPPVISHREARRRERSSPGG